MQQPCEAYVIPGYYAQETMMSCLEYTFPGWYFEEFVRRKHLQQQKLDGFQWISLILVHIWWQWGGGASYIGSDFVIDESPH